MSRTYVAMERSLSRRVVVKGNVEKALTHCEAFVELWKDADPDCSVAFATCVAGSSDSSDGADRLRYP